jgi:hypothetical protein
MAREPCFGPLEAGGHLKPLATEVGLVPAPPGILEESRLRYLPDGAEAFERCIGFPGASCTGTRRAKADSDCPYGSEGGTSAMFDPYVQMNAAKLVED